MAEPTGDAAEAATGTDSLADLAGVFDDVISPKAKRDAKDAPGEEAQASEEEPDEAGEADEGGAEEEADDETESDEEQPQKFRVKVDGEDLEVTLDELTRGYSREADYTRKTMALSDATKAERAELATQKEAIGKEREQYKAVLDYWAKTINEQMGSPDELEKLRNSANPEDRQEYTLRIADQVRFREKLGAIEAEQKRLKDKESGEQAGISKARIAEEAKKLMASVPEWKDPAKWEADGKRMLSYASSLGVTAEEYNQITDHRMLRALHDAARYRELQSKKIEPVRKIETVAPAKPGTVAVQSSAPRSRIAKADSRLKSTGHVNDLASAFKARGIA